MMFYRLGKRTTTTGSRPLAGVRAAALGAVICGCLLTLSSPSFATASPAWLPAVDLSLPGKDASNPVVAMDDAGETVAIWERQSGISHNLQVSTRTPGGAFSAPVELAPASTQADVAMTPAGEAVAVWRQFDVGSGTYAIQIARRPPGGVFSAPLEISSPPAASQPQGLRVAVNAAGDAAVVWSRTDPGSAVDPDQYFVEASVCPASGGCSAAAVLSPPPLVLQTEAGGADVALDGAGNAFVVWEYFDGTDHRVQNSVRSAGGSFTAPQFLGPAGSDALSPQVAANAAGEAIAVWTQAEGSDTIAQASIRPAGGGFSAPQAISEAGADASGPEVAISAAGAALVDWTAAKEAGTRIQAAARAPGEPFSPPEDVSTTGEGAHSPALAMNASGTALIAWSGLSGGEDIVRAAIRPAGGHFSAPVGVSATDAGFFHPAVALDGLGDAIAVWSRFNGANTIVQAAGYDADAPQLRDLSIPSSGTVGVPVAFSVNPFDVWPISSTSFTFGDGAAAAGRSATHVYSAAGKFPVTVRATDAAGTAVEAAGEIAIRPSGKFTLGKLSRNKKKGTATIVVAVSGPGKVVLSGKGVKRVSRRLSTAGKVRLRIAPKGRTLKLLRVRGKAKVRLRIAFTPDGGTTAAKQRRLVLIAKP